MLTVIFHNMKESLIVKMIQQIINQLYRYPKSNWKNIKRFGGIVSYRKMLKGKKEMIRASYWLPEIVSHQDGLPIYFLTGKNYLYQTLFCAKSLVNTSQEKFKFILVDDGSFDDQLIERASKQMPGVEIITKDIIRQNVENTLPEEKFPYLHWKRKVYPHIKKLTDVHTLSNNPYKLVLDSDMLFWDEPKEIINWLQNPQGCIHMVDSKESYGYDRKVMQLLSGKKISSLVNVGAIGCKSSIINWQDLERWAKHLEMNYGASYFLEQALSAMIIAEQQQTILDKDDYIVNPLNTITRDLRINKLHHYVDLSKKFYFEKAWKKI